MSTVSFRVGDVFERLAEIPDGSIDLVLTSPPFLALRSYLPAGHPDKDKEIGSEPTPAKFIDTMMALAAEWRRVLAPHGSIAAEFGDTYSRAGSDGWPLDKSLAGVPHLFHLSLAYGRNLLTGEDSPAGLWRVRNVVAWCRPNPTVGALGDKFRPATSYMTIACTDRNRFFDLDAVRVPSAGGSVGGARERDRQGRCRNGSNPEAPAETRPPYDHVGLMAGEDDLFLDEGWLIGSEPYSGSHYATWPRNLLDRPILAMCPQRVCTVCGEPSRRVTEKSAAYAAKRAKVGDFKNGRDRSSGLNGATQYVDGEHMERSEMVTVGWTDCGHEAWRRGVVLDPFGGSGTTGQVAAEHGRDAILIDLDSRNVDLARGRCGMFLEVQE